MAQEPKKDASTQSGSDIPKGAQTVPDPLKEQEKKQGDRRQSGAINPKTTQTDSEHLKTQDAMKENTMQTDSNKLSEDIDRLKADVRRLSETLEKVAGEGADTASALFRAKARQAREGAARAQHAAEEGFDEAVEYTRSRITERPMGAVAAALGVGVLLGLLMRKR